MITSILPADSYVVVNKSLLNENDRLTLTMLYQPIVGSMAITLYYTLWADWDKSLILSKEYTHHHLMNNLGIKLDDIVVARRKLEAIGLMKTYYKMGSINNYVYELPAGLIDNNDDIISTVKRELKEELNIEVDIEKYLFNIENEKNIEYFYLCKYLSGNFTLNGEELERMNEDNYYEPTFIPISDIEKYDILDSIKKYFTKK